MTPEDRRFLRKVYAKADKARNRRRQVLLLCLCILSALLFGFALLCSKENMLLCLLAGMLWLASMSALEWMTLRRIKPGME